MPVCEGKGHLGPSLLLHHPRRRRIDNGGLDGGADFGLKFIDKLRIDRRRRRRWWRRRGRNLRRQHHRRNDHRRRAWQHMKDLRHDLWRFHDFRRWWRRRYRLWRRRGWWRLDHRYLGRIVLIMFRCRTLQKMPDAGEQDDFKNRRQDIRAQALPQRSVVERVLPEGR